MKSIQLFLWVASRCKNELVEPIPSEYNEDKAMGNPPVDLGCLYDN